MHCPAGIIDEEPHSTSNESVYRKIELEEDEIIHKKLRSLDTDQRMVIDVCVNYAKELVKSMKSNKLRPEAPLLMVHGGAGTGKSHVIDALSQIMEKIFRKPGDDPNHPYVLKTAFTGNAAFIIRGQTLHSSFNFPFSNEILSLSDKLRDQRRKLLQNLRVLIIDEISLVKSDMLYQLQFRLMKDIFQNNLPFGGVSVVVFGDILQIKPPKGSFVFEKPTSPKLQLSYAADNLWTKFKVITLKTNHRQGEDKEYAELLNRIRTGDQTNADVQLLKTRCFDRMSKDLPKDALFITGTNAVVSKVNNEKISETSGETITIQAIVQSDNGGTFRPKLDNTGNIRGTTLQYDLKLKQGCRVMLTSNLDVCDSLTNGTQGTVLDFRYSSGSKPEHIIVKFDEDICGKERRKRLNIEALYPGQNATLIQMSEIRFSLSKTQGRVSSSATAIQFPLRLSYAATAHKIQGHTVKKPSNLITDLETWLQPAMAYVMLSRIQSLNQLFIVGSVPEAKIRPWPTAIMEKERLDTIDMTKHDIQQDHGFTVASFNTRSIRKHINDIKEDRKLRRSNVLCIQESWLEENDIAERYSLPDKMVSYNNAGRGKGIITYFDNNFSHTECVCNQDYQISRVDSVELTIINIYRSKTEDGSFINELDSLLLAEEKTTILCGDFNFCEAKEKCHPIRKFLKSRRFHSLTEGKAINGTHIEGRSIDHVYIRSPCIGLENIVTTFKPCYYSDHDQIFATLIDIN